MDKSSIIHSRSKALCILRTRILVSRRPTNKSSLKNVVSNYIWLYERKTFNFDNTNIVRKQQYKQLLYKEGNMLARVNYIQSEADTPELDVEQGRFSEIL